MQRIRQYSHRAVLGSFAALAMAHAAGCAPAALVAEPVFFPAPPAPPHAVHLISFTGINEVAPPPATLLDLIVGPPLGAFVDAPAGIAYRENVLYICDPNGGVVHVWDLAEGTTRHLGDGGSQPLAGPFDVAVDEIGNVYVADPQRHEVLAYGPEGGLRFTVRPEGNEAFHPLAVAICDSKLYVADASTHQVVTCNAADGSQAESIGQIGSEAGQFYFPSGVACNEAGLFVSDMFNSRVQGFDAAGTPKLSMGQPGDRYGDMGKPKHLDVGPDGTLFIADVEFGHLHLFNTQGQLLMLLGGPEPGPGGTPMSSGVAVADTIPERLTELVPAAFNPDYYLFVADRLNPRHISLYAIGTSD